MDNVEHTPWRRRAPIWLGIGINPASISLGGGLAARLALSELLFLIPIGVALLTLLLIAQGRVGVRRRLPLAGIGAETFGPNVGARILNLTMALGMIGWGGFQAGLASVSLAALLTIPLWAAAALVVIALAALAELGVNRWAFLLWLTTGAAVALTIFALMRTDVAAVGAVALAVPGDLLPGQWFWAIGSIIAYAGFFSLRSPDFTWDFASGADVVRVNLFLLIPLIFSLFAGTLLYQSSGDWNIADVLTKTQSATLGHLFLLIAVASPLLSGLHSGTLALANLSTWSARTSRLLICACIFVLAASRFDSQLLGFLDMIAALVTPALVIILAADAMAVKPRARHAVAAWLSGAGIALFLKLQGYLGHFVVGAVVSLLLLWVLHRRHVEPS